MLKIEKMNPTIVYDYLFINKTIDKILQTADYEAIALGPVLVGQKF